MSNRMFNGSDLDVPTEISKTYIGAQEQFWLDALSAATKKKLTVGTTATTSHRRGRPVIDGRGDAGRRGELHGCWGS